MKIDAVFGGIVTFATISFNNNKVLQLVLEQLVSLFFFVFISQRSTRPISQRHGGLERKSISKQSSTINWIELINPLNREHITWFAAISLSLTCCMFVWLVRRWFNPFMSNGISHPYLLDISISNLTNLWRMYFPILINWTSPFPIVGLLGGIFHFYSDFKRNFCKQIVENLIRRHVLRRLILFCTVCDVPQKGH